MVLESQPLDSCRSLSLSLGGKTSYQTLGVRCGSCVWSPSILVSEGLLATFSLSLDFSLSLWESRQWDHHPSSGLKTLEMFNFANSSWVSLLGMWSPLFELYVEDLLCALGHSMGMGRSKTELLSLKTGIQKGVGMGVATALE